MTSDFPNGAGYFDYEDVPRDLSEDIVEDIVEDEETEDPLEFFDESDNDEIGEENFYYYAPKRRFPW